MKIPDTGKTVGTDRHEIKWDMTKRKYRTLVKR